MKEYTRITKLAGQLQKGKVTDRRKHGQQLLELLTKKEIRRKIALEAAPDHAGPDDPSVCATQCHAISQLWTVTLVAAIGSVQSFQTGKAKISAADVQLPYKLLIACDEPDEVFDDTGLAIPKLSKKTVRAVLNYCLNMLNDDKAVELCEVDLLNMLKHMCSRPEYVGFFTKKFFTSILGEISERLGIEVEEDKPHIFLQAAEALDSLFRTCRTLGIQMNSFTTGVLEIVAEWCKNSLHRESVRITAIGYFYNTAASILFSHPDTSIGPMKRCGRPILSYCKRCYSATSALEKDALNNYVLAMLFVSQVAGELQGYITGDLGSLGRASLKDRHINDLLDLVMRDVGKVVSIDDSSKRKRDFQLKWTKLELKQRRHLEVAARLMAVAQRRYLAQVELALLGDNVEQGLAKYLMTREEGSDEWTSPNLSGEDRVPDDAFIESPFVRHIAQKLCPPSSSAAGYPPLDSVSPQQLDFSLEYPILNRLREKATTLMDSHIGYLAVVCSCTEIFPGGECWTSTIGIESWRRFKRNSISLSDDHGVVYYHGSSMDDFGLLLSLICDMLETNGGPQGDVSLQSWILGTLIGLTESFEAQIRNGGNQVGALEPVGFIWRRIWKALVRSDLRYHAYTEGSSENSLGDLVLTLLAKMISAKCTDPQLSIPGALSTKKSSFIFENQARVWALPVFKDCRAVSSIAPLVLISSILAATGLSDAGNDKIDASLSKELFPDDKVAYVGRRKRLLCLGLGCLKQWTQSHIFKDGPSALCSFPALVVLTLVNTATASSVNKILVRRLKVTDGSRFHFTTLPSRDQSHVVLEADQSKESAYQHSCLQLLWDFRCTQDHQAAIEDYGRNLDLPWIVATRIRHETNSLYRFPENADFIPNSESEELRNAALLFFDEYVVLSEGEEDGSYTGTSLSSEHRKEKITLKSMAIKFKMSLSLFVAKQSRSDEFAMVATQALEFLSDASTRLADISDASEYCLLASELVRIAEAILEISPFQSSNTSSTNLEETAECFKTMLLHYFLRNRQGGGTNVLVGDEDAKEGEQGGLWSDEEDAMVAFDPKGSSSFAITAPHPTSFDEYDNEGSRKRKRSLSADSISRSRKRSTRSKDASVGTPPSVESAFHIGAALMVLDPSPSTCELVCQTLLGTELGFDPSDIDGDLDLRMSLNCIRLINCRASIFHAKAKELFSDPIMINETNSSSLSKRSIISTVSTAIELIRSCAGPSSPFYFKGYLECASLIAALKIPGSSLKVAENEISQLVEILRDEGGVQSRPWLRAERISAATSAFLAGDETFHQAFDKTFPNSFVKGALQDLSFSVRRKASVAVGIAMRVLDERKIVQSVLQLIPPLTEMNSGEDVTVAFCNWYDQVGYTHAVDASTRTDIRDAAEAMESDSVFCLAIISGSAKSLSLFQSTLFDLLMISMRRYDLEFVCFWAIEKVAHMRDYRDVEEMINCEAEGLLKRWVESDYDELPLAFTAPNVLRRMVVCGMDATGGDREMQELRRRASDIYVSRYRHILLPVLLLNSTSAFSRLPGPSNDSAAILKTLAKNSKLRLICQIISGHEEPEHVIRRMLRHHFADIHAFVSPITCSESSKFHKIAQNAAQVLESVLTTDVVETRLRKKSHVIIRRIFELAGSSCGDLLPLESEAYFRAILNLVDIDSRSKRAGDIFLRFGTNATENLIRAFVRLDTSHLSHHRRSRWSEIQLQCKFIEWQIQCKDMNHVQLGFCIHILTEAMLKRKLVLLRPDILSLLKSLLDEALRNMDESQLEQELTPMMQRLIGACMVVHEERQQELLSSCRDKARNFERLIRRSCGLLTIYDTHDKRDAWGWEATDGMTEMREAETRKVLKRYSLSIGNDVRNNIANTYDVLEQIFQNAHSLALKPQHFLSAAPPYGIESTDLSALAAVEERFCAQNLAHRFIQEQGHTWVDMIPDMQTLVNGLEERLNGKHAWIKSARTETDDPKMAIECVSSGILNVDQRLLYAELKQLERKLRESEFDGVSVKNLEDLIKELCFVCGSSCPTAIKFVASRCLGELDPPKMASLCNAEILEWSADYLEAGIEEGNVLDILESRCIESLAQNLKSADPNVAVVAAKTVSSLFSTETRQNRWSLLHKKECWKVLNPFASTALQSNRGWSGLLSRREIALLRAKATSTKEGDQMWCWDAELWKCRDQRESTFQEWICTLTCAMILCCFYNKSNNQMQSNGDYHFFWRCQKMVLLDHDFASRVFQCIILRLASEGPASDTFDYNQTLSLSFSLLLDVGDQETFGQSTPNIKALSLAIDTLHLLCRVSLRKFASLPHTHNRSKREKRQIHKQEAYNDGLPAPEPWKGLPFGVTLKLDGLVVARACMQAQRYASGLFFLELYFDARFGKSGGILEELATFRGDSKFDRKSDISGDLSIPRNGTVQQPENMDGTDSVLAAMELSALSLQALGEREALDAIETQTSALNFLDIGTSGFSGHPQKASLDTLRQLSIQTEHSHGLPLQVSDCMAELGCHRILTSYIEGVLASHEDLQKLSRDDIGNLQEKWFETKLKTQQWSVLENKPGVSVGTESMSQTTHPLSLSQSVNEAVAMSVALTTDSRRYNPIYGNSQSFYQSLFQALAAFQDQDVKSCQEFLAQGRSALLGGVARAGFGESPLLGVAKMVDKLRALRDVEFVSSKMKTVEELVDIWNIPESPTDAPSELPRLITFFPDNEQASNRSVGGIEVDIQSLTLGIRETLLRALCKTQPVALTNGRPFRVLLSYLWGTCVRTREAGRPNVAEAALQNLRSLLRTPSAGLEGVLDEKLKLQIRIEEACLAECRGDFSSAIRTLKQVVDFLKGKGQNGEALDSDAGRILTDAQISCGAWMTKYKIQEARVVLETYLQPGADRAKMIFDRNQSIENTERSTHASLEYGQIVSNLYEALSSRVRSLEWKQAGVTLSHQEQEYERAKQLREDAQCKVKDTPKKSKMYVKYYNQWVELHHFCETLKKDIEASSKEREKILKSMGEYLNQAIQSFIVALSMAETGIKADLSRHMFRLISLWFSSSRDSRLDETANTLLAEGIHNIPTYRFLPLTYQLVSRLESKGVEDIGAFQSTLQKLVFKMTVDHPYHLLVPLIALSNGNRVENVRHTSDFLENVGDKKTSAAAEILDKLQKKAPKCIGDILQAYVMLTHSYIQLAHAPTAELQKKTTKRIRFSQVAPKGGSSRSKVPALDVCLRNIDSPPCILTAPPPVRPGADYGDGLEDPPGAERVSRFESTFDITETGIHRPKIVVCIGSKGGRYRQLVKGEDDLRQDAIMNQVFRYVNGLMVRRGNSSTGNGSSNHFQKGLKIVTYNVSPLSPMSGVLEWVEDTIPFGSYEEDKRGAKTGKTAGAHSRYYPGEWGNQLCRIHLGESPVDEKRRSFDEICRRHSPVFRFFFVERFGHCLQTWHLAKMNFTRSVAVSSIVGHILGIGDRHCKNILVHEKTGNVVHIDFGIVFEQGKLLTTPERVPFRLTRNLVDGMGPSGTEGTFVAAAEETTGVLRNNSDALLTIISAVVDDPLYKWSLSPVEARKRQRKGEANDGKVVTDGGLGSMATDHGSYDDQNKAAAKAVAKIKSKLQGYEDWTSGEQHGILGQVILLINSARDPENLCRMFPGWGPWV